MAFSIKNDEADELLRELTRLTGESLTTAVTESLRERLERTQRTRDERAKRFQDAIDALRALPVLNEGPAELEWDEIGLPK